MADEPMTEPSDTPAGEAIVSTDPLADAQRERDEYYDRWMRKAAEFDNYRKRIDRERREQADQAVLDILQELLLVVDDFDPNVHQAVMQESSPDHRDGEVIGELRKGYMIGDRLLRPAMVKVAKA